MKNNWQIKTLGEVCEKIDNISWSTFPNHEFKYIDLTSVSRDSLSVTNTVIVNAKNAPSRAKKIVKSDDIIFGTTRPTLRRIAKIKSDYNEQLCSTGFSVLRAKNDLVISDYIFYFLQTDTYNERMGRIQRGTSYPAVTDNDVKDSELPVPPLTEQKRIVKILDEKFEAIEELKKVTEQQIVDAKELFESHAEYLFSVIGSDWEEVYLGDVCKINDGTHFSPKNSSEGEYMYITAKNIKPYQIDLNKVTYISKKDHDEIYARCSPEYGDVLYIKDGATAGIATINTLKEPFSLLSSVALLKCSPKILNKFLVHYMNSISGRKNFLGYVGGAAITRLTLVKIKNVTINLPTFKEQNQIVKELDELSEKTKELEAIFRRKIADLEELKKSYLEQAFAGKL